MINTNTLSVEYLGSLPDNTFGKEYWRFLDKNVSIVIGVDKQIFEPKAILKNKFVCCHPTHNFCRWVGR